LQEFKDLFSGSGFLGGFRVVFWVVFWVVLLTVTRNPSCVMGDDFPNPGKIGIIYKNQMLT